MQEIMGDVIKAALNKDVDVIVQCCNCYCTQKSGIATQMVAYFRTDKFELENDFYKGDITKLGQIDQGTRVTSFGNIYVINAYGQYHWSNPGPYGIPLDYDALRLCFRKINHKFKGYKIGLPGLIGAGLASGEPKIIRQIIKEEFKNCNVTIYYLNEIPHES